MLRVEFFVPIIYTLAAVFYALLGLYAWRRRPAVAVIPFAWVMVSMSIWSLTYGLEVFLPTLSAKLFAVNLEYIGIASAPVFLFHYALDYTGRGHLITPRMRALIWLIPVTTLLLTWTNPLHHHMWDMESIVRVGGLELLSVRFRTAFWISIAFAYGLFTLAGSMLVMDFLQRPGVYRLHISFVVLALLFSFAGTVLFVFGISPIPGLDLTSLFFLPTGIGLAWITLQYCLAEVLTIEYLTVLKNMKESVIVLNDERRILYVNPVAEQTIGKTEDQAIGQPFEQVAKPFHRALEPCLDGNEHRMEIQVRAGNEAKTFEAGVGFMPSSNRAGNNIVVTLRDITQQKEREGELSRRGAIMSAISMAAEQFLISHEWEENIPAVLKSLGRAADVCRIFVVLNSTGDDGVVRSSLTFEWSAPGIPPQIDNPSLQHVPLEETGFGRWLETLSKGRSLHDLIKDLPPYEAEFMKPLGSLSFAAIPIFVEGQWWAFMLFEECRYERRWTEMELDAFHTAASIIGAAEARARAEQKVVRRQRALNLLHEIVKISLEAGSVESMAQTVVNHLGELIGTDGCFMTLWDPGAERTIPVAAYGLENRDYSQIKNSPEKRTFTKSVLEQGRTLVIEDTADTPHADQSVIQNFPSKSVLALPLIAKNKKLGAVLLTFNQTHHFTTDEIAIGEQAADLIALALEKYQAMDDVRRRADTSETLRKAGIAIAEQQDFKQAVAHILDQLKQVVSYDSASVQLLVGDEIEIVGGSGWKNETDVLGLRFPIPGDNPNSVVIRTGKPYRLGDIGKVYKKFTVPPHSHIRSWLGVPLIVQGKITGLLAIDSNKPDDFSGHEAGIALEFANQVAVILENARILQETQTQAVTDPLTGVYNRRGLMEMGGEEFKRAQLSNRHFSAILLDLDHFKRVNDTHGHAAGDMVLREFANRCKSCIREIDYIGRYGGEEIIIFLPDTNLKSSVNVAERLRAAIANTPVRLNEKEEINITASLGVACKDENTTSLDMLIARADQAMYIAKHNGRNRVAISR